MRLSLVLAGKTTESWVEEAMDQYSRRLRRFVDLKVHEVSLPKHSNSISNCGRQQKETEAVMKATQLRQCVLLDKSGRQLSSEQLASFLEKTLPKDAAFVIGGPYGFTEDVLSKAQSVLSLSPMTFPHQLVRVIFLEQLYRAFTILSGEKYHHE